MTLTPAVLMVWAELDWETGRVAWRWELAVRGVCEIKTVRSHKHAAGARRAALARARRFGLHVAVEATTETPIDKRRAQA